MLPKTTKGIIEHIIDNHNYSATEISQLLGVSTKTISRLLKGAKPLPKTYTQLMRLYFALNNLSDLTSSVDRVTLTTTSEHCPLIFS